jgi:hypothetical protein
MGDDGRAEGLAVGRPEYGVFLAFDIITFNKY